MFLASIDVDWKMGLTIKSLSTPNIPKITFPKQFNVDLSPLNQSEPEWEATDFYEGSRGRSLKYYLERGKNIWCNRCLLHHTAKKQFPSVSISADNSRVNAVMIYQRDWAVSRSIFGCVCFGSFLREANLFVPSWNTLKTVQLPCLCFVGNKKAPRHKKFGVFWTPQMHETRNNRAMNTSKKRSRRFIIPFNFIKFEFTLEICRVFFFPFRLKKI